MEVARQFRRKLDRQYVLAVERREWEVDRRHEIKRSCHEEHDRAFPHVDPTGAGEALRRKSMVHSKGNSSLRECAVQGRLLARSRWAHDQ
jgi:hypothetical protein